MDAIKWIENITSSNLERLEPVEGDWGEFYAGSLTSGKASIVIPVSSDKDCEFESGLFQVKVENVNYIGPAFVVTWNYRSDHELALLFIEDLIKTVGFFYNPIEEFRKKQEVWKDFSQDDPHNKLLNQLIGFWGEVKFISKNPETAKYWTGPAGTDLDFTFENSVVEIKTTRKKAKNDVSISNIWQLDDTFEDVFLVFNRVEISSDAGESINDLFKLLDVEDFQEQVLQSARAEINKLGKKLCSIKLSLREINIFPVQDEFPKLTKNNLGKCLGASVVDRINRVNYSVSLSGLRKISEEELKSKIIE